MPIWAGQTLHRGVYEGDLPGKEKKQGRRTAEKGSVTQSRLYYLIFLVNGGEIVKSDLQKPHNEAPVNPRV